MSVSQNGWSVIGPSFVHQWDIGGRILPLRNGVAGFCLAHWAWYFHHNVESLTPSFDDWGWALRRISGSDEWSNHASGTAEDLNSDAHPQGRRGTFTAAKTLQIRDRLAVHYGNRIKWGGDFRFSPDEMHYEINGSFKQIQALAAHLEQTNIGIELRKIA